MNVDDEAILDEQLTAKLLAYDEALAGGKIPLDLVEIEDSESRTRLERGLACLELLQQLRPRSSRETADDALTTSIIRSHPRDFRPRVSDPDCPVRIGRFEIRRTLGGGGFGIVYLAYDPALCREVALKIPRAGALADADCLVRFQREARAAAALDHPNLVPVHEAGQIGPVCYLALAYCPGHNLAEWLKLHTAPVGSLRAAQLAFILARAIHYAHVRGVLHRDLKPNNILLSACDPSETQSQSLTSSEACAGGIWCPDETISLIPRITDFGLARIAAADHAHTQTGAVLGTPCYMAPEQAEGSTGQVCPATDVYSLGAILYELVTGRPPFRADTAVATLLQVKTSEPVPPARLQPQMPRDLETICLKCLQKEPRKRYGSAEALVDDLHRFLSGRPILARPASRMEQTLKWCKRRPALAAALVALILVTACGVAGIVRQWHATQAALQDEASAHRRAELSMQQAQLAQQAESAAREKSEVALYHHRVVLAHHEWSASNIGRAGQLLDECREDLRDWEWHYVRRLCDSDLFTLQGHTAPGINVAFSPDGRLLASVAGKWFTSEPGDLKIWDTMSGTLAWTGIDERAPIMGVAFSPDGRQVATSSVGFGTNAGSIKLWEVASGKLLETFSGGYGGFCIAYSPDGKVLASGGPDGRVRFWDLLTGKDVVLPSVQKKGSVFGLAFSPDGRLLASAGWDGTAHIWDVSTRTPLHTLVGPIDLRSIAFSPDGKRVVASSYDRSAKIWDVATGILLRTYWGHAGAVLSARFSPDGRYVASSDNAGVVQIWHSHTLREHRIIRGHTGAVSAIAFGPEGRRLATIGTDQVVRIWDVRRDQEALVLDQTGPAQNVIFSSDGKYLAAAGYKSNSGGRREQNVRVWSANDIKKPLVWPGHTDWINSVAFQPGGKLLASGSGDKTIRLWEVPQGRTTKVLTGHKEAITGLNFSPDGSRLASSSTDKTVKLWDIPSGRQLPIELEHPHPVQDVIFSRDGQRLVTVGDSGMVKLWNAETGAELGNLRGHHDSVERVQLSPDGSLLATSGRDRSIHIWDMKSALGDGSDLLPIKVLLGPSEPERVTGLAFSADGRRLASGGRDHSIRIWDIDSGNETLTLRGNLDVVNGLAFSPDGRLLVSASTRNIRIWDAGDARTDGPRMFQPSDHDEKTWHLKQANECQSATTPDWFGAAFHLTQLIDAGPTDWLLFARRADVNVELDRWQAALDDCARSAALGAKNPWVWFLEAVVHLQQENLAGYRKSCSAMLERYKQTTNWEFANNVAWGCTLAPEAIENYEPITQLAQRAVKAQPQNGAFRSTLGAVYYRAGQLQAAKENLLEARRLFKDDDPEDWLFLAMTYQRLGDQAEAQRWFEKTDRWCNKSMDTIATHKPASLSHERVLEIELLRREAKAVLASKEKQ